MQKVATQKQAFLCATVGGADVDFPVQQNGKHVARTGKLNRGQPPILQSLFGPGMKGLNGNATTCFIHVSNHSES
jgi:hypothetical protein